MKKVVVVALLLILFFLFYLNNQGDQKKVRERQVNINAENVSKTMTKNPATYKVQKGEGLWRVAQKELGTGERWFELATENGIKKPYTLFVGQELKIPGKDVEVVVEGNNEQAYTLVQVGEHSNRDNCWLAIEGKVYDVTPFVSSGFHPGKDAILEGCGKDATELFNTRPMGSKTPHSERARGNLPKYFIGNLTK